MPNAFANASRVLEYTVSEGLYNTEIGLSILHYCPFLAATSCLLSEWCLSVLSSPSWHARTRSLENRASTATAERVLCSARIESIAGAKIKVSRRASKLALCPPSAGMSKRISSPYGNLDEQQALHNQHPLERLIATPPQPSNLWNADAAIDPSQLSFFPPTLDF